MTQDTPASEPEHGPERCPVAWCPVLTAARYTNLVPSGLIGKPEVAISS